MNNIKIIEGKQRLELGRLKNKRVRVSGKVQDIKIEKSFLTDIKHINVMIKNVIINNTYQLHHLWIPIEDEELLDFFKVGEQKEFTAKVYSYCRKNGSRSYSVKDVKNIK